MVVTHGGTDGDQWWFHMKAIMVVVMIEIDGGYEGYFVVTTVLVIVSSE